MAEIDGNGPTIEINVDTKKAQENIKNLDQSTADAFEKMNKRADSFSENIKKTFNDFKNGGGMFSPQPSSSNGANSSQNVARENIEQQYKAKMVNFQQQAIRQRNVQVETGKQLLASSKNMVLAVAGLVGGGLGAKAMLDFTHQLGKLQNFLQATSSNKTNAIAYRNEFKRRNVDDGSYWSAYGNINETLIKMQSGESGRLPDKQAWALRTLQNIDPSIQFGIRQGGRLNTDEQLKRIVNAAQQLKKRNPKMDNSQLVDLIQQATGGDINFSQAALNGRLNISKADMAKAKSEADAIPANAKVDAAKQELATTYETEQAKVIAAISPMAIEFMKALNGFVGNYGALAMAGTALGSFGGAILGFLGTIKLAKSLLPTLGGAVPKGGLLSDAWKGAKTVGGQLWNGTKWVAGKGVEASEWVARHPVEAVETGGKLGGRLASAGAMAAWDLTIGNITDAKSTTNWDDVSYRNGKQTRAGRAKEIERALDARVLQSTWNNKYYVQTKDGVYVYVDSNFYEPIEQIKKRLQQGQQDIPSEQTTPSIGRSLVDAVIPSARAGDLASDRARWAKGATWSHAQVSRDEQEKITRMIREGASRNGYEDFQANAIIASANRESGFDINAVGDNGRSKGLFQWDEARRRAFEQHFKIPFDKSTAQQQVDFLFWEMKNSHRRAGDILKKSRNDVEANISIVRDYEISKNQGSDIQKQLSYLPTANSLGRGRNAINPRPTLSQMQAQAQANRIHNETRNTTNNGGHTIHNNPTVNINVANGTVDNIKRGVEQGLRFPSVGSFNLRTGQS